MSRSKLAHGLPRLGRPARRAIEYRARRGVYAVPLVGDGVLLTFQESPVPELQLPGGGIDPGESPLRALHREVAEETGWRIAECRRIGGYRRFTYMPEYRMWAEKVCLVYLARAVRPLSPPSEAGHRAMVVPLATAAELAASEGDRDFLAQVAAQRLPS